MAEAGAPQSAPSPRMPFDAFRLAFLLAALTAMRALAFPPKIWNGDYSSHADELIFGFMLVQLFGFMLKSLPRQIGRPILSPALTRLMLAAQALAFLAGFYDLGIGAEIRSIVGFITVLCLSGTAIRARATRVYPLLALAAAHAGTGILAAFDLWPGATMLGFALILSICFEVGNRIFPMVIEAGRALDGRPAGPPPPAWLSIIQRVASLATLLLYGFGLPHALPAAIAGISGLAWTAWIRPWQAFRHGGVRFMTFAIAAKRIGFLLLAADAAPDCPLPPAIAIHVLAIGGLASLAVAIATSIVRKRNGQSFRRSALGSATYLCLAAALALRVGYAALPDRSLLLTVAQAFWLLGFAGYAVLILRKAPTRCAD
ncbi:NnrS family protein [Neorhizobium sp. NCHU2750]|uniref:NnrS family protein n=1 Tax=Neorhizobium sp. NCHU2750 TaxID=1825976 RepID=UPI0013C45EBC